MSLRSDSYVLSTLSGFLLSDDGSLLYADALTMGIGFLRLSAYTVSQYGYVGFFAAAVFANLATLTAAVDLVIALSVVTVWTWFVVSAAFLQCYILSSL